MGEVEQQIVLFKTETTGVFSIRRNDNFEQIDQLLAQVWRVVSMSPTGSPSTNVGSFPDVCALIVLEREAANGR